MIQLPAQKEVASKKRGIPTEKHDTFDRVYQRQHRSNAFQVTHVRREASGQGSAKSTQLMVVVVGSPREQTLHPSTHRNDGYNHELEELLKK